MPQGAAIASRQLAPPATASGWVFPWLLNQAIATVVGRWRRRDGAAGLSTAASIL